MRPRFNFAEHRSKRQSWCYLAAYTSDTIGGDHVRRFVCG